MRKIISGIETPPVTQLLTQTNVLQVLANVLGFNDTDPIFTEMKIESIWIMTNLAYGTEEDVEFILDPKYQILTHICHFL